MDDIETLKKDLDEANAEIDRLRKLISEAVESLDVLHNLISLAMTDAKDVRDNLKNE